MNSSTKSQETSTVFDPQLLSILVCPLMRCPLRLEGNELVGTVGGLRYPIREGIPILLIDQAKLPQGVSSLEQFKEKFRDQIPK